MEELAYILELRKRPDQPKALSWYEPFRVRDPSRNWGCFKGPGMFRPVMQHPRPDLVAFVGDLAEDRIGALEAQMRPGAASRAGFLGNSDRLIDVVTRDDETLRILGVTHEQIADRLESIVQQAWREDELSKRFEELLDAEPSFSSPHNALVEGCFCLYVAAYFGHQNCPVCTMRFANTKKPIVVHSYSSVDFTLTNRRRQSKIWFPGLIIHLVRDHHFFEGDTRYRLDPTDAVQVLEIVPGVDYSPRYDQERLWLHLGSILPVDGGKEEVGDISLPIEDMVASPDNCIELNEVIRAFIVGNSCVLVATGTYKAPRPPVFDDTILPQRTIWAGVHCFGRTVEPHIHLTAPWEWAGR
jgi:hypothetical protein